MSMHPKIKAKVDKMAKLGIITPVDEPTDWVSSLGYAWKEYGELCFCLDPPHLNNAICRDLHCTPSVDDIAHEFTHSKYFTKLEARHGYWAVVLDSKSSLLTTFNIPYGQYNPSCLACSQDVSQKRMDQILEEYEGPPVEAHGCCPEVWVNVQPQ